MSHNGAEGAILEALPLMGGAGTFQTIIDRYYDNSLKKRRDGELLCLGRCGMGLCFHGTIERFQDIHH